MFFLILSSLLVVRGFAIDVAQPNPAIQKTCPRGVAAEVNPFYLQVKNGTCFHFVVYDRQMYMDASLVCHNHGGTLALPKTPDLNNYLTDQVFNFYNAKDNFWIGLRDKKDGSKFTWEDEQPIGWHHFAPGSGPASNWVVARFKDCGSLDPVDGFWYDFPCNNALLSAAFDSDLKKMYICQY